MVRLSDDLASLYRTVEIAGDEGVDVLSGHLVADAFRLGNARLVELSLHLALHQVGGVVEGLAMSHKK